MVDADDDERTDDGRTPDHGHTISSPCEPNGSGELKKKYSSALWSPSLSSVCVFFRLMAVVGISNM